MLRSGLTNGGIPQEGGSIPDRRPGRRGKRNKGQTKPSDVKSPPPTFFRALKTRGNTPKYGLIFYSSFIGRASAQNKGRMARYLANKCSIASQIDCFLDKNTTTFGEKLRELVRKRRQLQMRRIGRQLWRSTQRFGGPRPD